MGRQTQWSQISCPYKFEFTYSIVSEICSGFVLLIESKLAEDVGNMELNLYLVSKIVKASVSSCGQVNLDAEQVMEAKSFHGLFFNGLFGRLVVRYWITLRHMGQALLRLKQSHNPHNLLFNFHEEAISAASLHTYVPKESDIANLEEKIGYESSVKGLLLEAITYLSEKELGVGCCYERVEFLGDSVLDLLIAWYLYQSHIDIDPGVLTDLRSASVSFVLN
ncbi:hypothetical protein VNO77_10675 [Canavalia gladiata]|uniref:RNase III domain-containing protein n=1 Tax=Canavalia gladiata TaxID=3824 RepID=A0AAN9QUV9_CANGL